MSRKAPPDPARPRSAPTRSAPTRSASTRSAGPGTKGAGTKSAEACGDEPRAGAGERGAEACGDEPRAGAGDATTGRRARILAAAERLVLQRGQARATIARIAAEAGIATGSVYLEFRNKDEVLFQLSCDTHQRALARLEAAAAADDPAVALTRFFDERLERFLAFRDEGEHRCALAHGTHSAAVARAWTRYLDDEARLLRALLDRGRATGVFSATAADVDAVRHAYARFAPPSLDDLSAADARRGQRALHALLLHGLRRRADVG